jgi:hypothetical protein
MPIAYARLGESDKRTYAEDGRKPPGTIIERT